MKLFHRTPKNTYIEKPKKKNYSVHRNKRTGFKHIVKSICFICMCTGFFIFVSYSVFTVYNYVINSSYFNITEINIHGSEYIDSDDLIKLSGIKKGMNSLYINIFDIEQNLYKNPWIQNVSVKRVLPDVFEITVKERKAEFWMLNRGKMYYADEYGMLIAPIQTENFLSLPQLQFINSNDTLKKAVAELLFFLKEKNTSISLNMISHIRVSDEKGIEIIIGNDQLSIFMQPFRWESGFKLLSPVLDDLAERDELKSTREIWVFDDIIWTVKKNME